MRSNTETYCKAMRKRICSDPMNPSEAITALLALPDWTESRIAVEAGTTQPTINRIKKGASPAYGTGVAIVALAERYASPKPKRKAA